MNGRIYDPLLGRMLSADPLISKTSDLQAYNRYSYVLNRPLTMVDPSGFDPAFTPDIGIFQSLKADQEVEAAKLAAPATAALVVAVATDGLAAPYIAAAAPGYLGTVGTGMLVGAAGDLAKQGTEMGLGTRSSISGSELRNSAATGGLLAGAGRLISSVWSRITGAAPKTELTPEVSPTKAPTTIRQNAEQGKAFEKVVGDGLKKTDTSVASQVTVKTESGVSTKIDFASKGQDGTVNLTEAKSSATAPLTKNQTAAFPEIEQTGGVVTGKGKPGFEGGTQIPPTKVKIVRPKAPGEPPDGN